MDFLIYDIKAAAVFALFYIFFRLLLGKETFHAFNRVVILFSCVIALVIPLCKIEIANPMTYHYNLPEVISISYDKPIKAGVSLNWGDAALIVFAAGFLAVCAGTAVSMAKVWRITRKNRRIPQEDGTTIVLCDEAVSPMSWMRYIIISEEDYNDNGESIILHEKAHIRFGHSWDVLFANLFVAVQWFNPTAWMMRSDLCAIHEYEADEAVLNAGVDAKSYQMLLVRKAVCARAYSVANSLNHSTLKRRINMMLCRRSKAWQSMKAFYVIPILGVGLWANATPVSSDAPGEDGAILVECNPSFKDGDANSFSEWVNKRLIYPEDAKDKNLQGRVTLSFCVEKNGKVTDVKVIRSAGKSLDDEAVRVVSSSPKWSPGFKDGRPVEVTYVFPVIFQLR